MMLSWLIVGGGVHGTYLSHYLTAAGGAPRDRVRVLDPHDEPLWRWNTWTANTGMDFLRSPVEHQLDLDSAALIQWAVSPAGRSLARFSTPHRRPSLALFRAHVEDVIARRALGELRVKGTARRLERIDGGLRVETDRGALEARRVVLAIGPDERVSEPDWAVALRRVGARIDHVFDLDFRRVDVVPGERVVVVGGGISGAQLALALAERAPGTITLITRHTPRIHPFDVEPRLFTRAPEVEAERDYRRRRQHVTAGRRSGSMPAEVAARLDAAVASGTIAHVLARISRVTPLPAGRVGFRLDPAEEDDGARFDRATARTRRAGSRLDREPDELIADRVILATGFDGARPGGTWIDRAITDLGLARAPCGYPIIDGTLRWAPGLYVTGPLAELQLGPGARGIAGARRSAEVLAAAA